MNFIEIQPLKELNIGYLDKLWICFRDEKGVKVKKCLILGVNYQFQPSNLRAWGTFSYNKVPQLHLMHDMKDFI